jgi:hypothetical protein
MRDLDAAGRRTWSCAAALLHDQADPCPERPDVAIAWPQMADDGPHVIVAPVCMDHREDTVQHAADHAIPFDGDATGSLEVAWASLSQLLTMLHSPDGLCAGASVTFAVTAAPAD